MTKDRAGLRVLGQVECMMLLDDHLPRIGRVAFSDDGRLLVLPVNYRIDGEAIVFRTSADSALGRIADGQAVTFQADEVDTTWAEGWSVIVEGSATHVTDTDTLERLRRMPLHPWAPGDRATFMRIEPEAVSGRRIE